MATRPRSEVSDIAPERSRFGAFQEIPRNCWYVAAGRSEVTTTPLARQLLGLPVVLFRDESGTALAMHDACPHRGFPLSKSQVVEGGIQCRYHGMVFDRTGRCIRLARPHDAIPGVMRVRTYPVVEKWHWLWIWMGDPALADPSSIPDFEQQDNAGYDHRFYSPMGPIACNFQLIHDNLCDATHTSYLHAGLLDDPGETQLALAEPQIRKIGDHAIQVWRDMKDFVPNEKVAPLYHLEAGRRYNRRLIGWHYFPSIVTFSNRYYEYQEDFGIDDPGTLVAEHITSLGITPAGPNSSYHLTAASTSWQQSDMDRDGLLHVIDQDLEAFADIQRYFENWPDQAVEISIANDKAGIMSRRMIADLVAREH